MAHHSCDAFTAPGAPPGRERAWRIQFLTLGLGMPGLGLKQDGNGGENFEEGYEAYGEACEAYEAYGEAHEAYEAYGHELLKLQRFQDGFDRH